MPGLSKPRFDVPPDACDCHVHVFDHDRFPYAPHRSYTPGPASVDDLLAFESRNGISRCVIVQPSVYGTDNACLTAALHRLGDRARGVAVIDPERTPDSALDALQRAGVRSVRVNLKTQGQRNPAAAGRALNAAARRIAGRGGVCRFLLGCRSSLRWRIRSAACPCRWSPITSAALARGGAEQPGLLSTDRAAHVRKGVRQALRTIPVFQARAGLRGSDRDRAGLHRCSPAATCVGVRLASHGWRQNWGERPQRPQPFRDRAVPAGGRAEDPGAARRVVGRPANLARHPRPQSSASLRLRMNTRRRIQGHT